MKRKIKIDFSDFWGEHHHWAAQKRNPDVNDQRYNDKWIEDDNTWKIRKNMSVEDRIKINL